MSEPVSDETLVDYLLGELDTSEADAMAHALRECKELRLRYFALQRSFEAAVEEGYRNHEVSGEMLDTVRERLSDTLGYASHASQAPAAVSSAGGPLGWGRRVAVWSLALGGAAAAVWLVALAIGMLEWGTKTSVEDHFGPSLVVYDITDEASVDLDAIESGANIRELVFIHHDGYDGLARAEAYAEQLWAEYLKKREHEPESIHGRGFVVMDLRGKHGFAGFYERQDASASSPGRDELLWLAGGQTQDVPVGSIDPEPGVFFFQLDQDQVKLATLNAFVPVARPMEPSDL